MGEGWCWCVDGWVEMGAGMMRLRGGRRGIAFPFLLGGLALGEVEVGGGAAGVRGYFSSSVSSRSAKVVSTWRGTSPYCTNTIAPETLPAGVQDDEARK